MVILTISITAKPNKRSELLSALRLFSDTIRKETGCQGCRLYQDIDDQNLIILEESWAQRSDLDAHLRSDIFSALLGAMKLLGQSQKIRINDGMQTEGMEVVESIRSKTV